MHTHRQVLKCGKRETMREERERRKKGRPGQSWETLGCKRYDSGGTSVSAEHYSHQCNHHYNRSHCFTS
jgi:hypothetical protein